MSGQDGIGVDARLESLVRQDGQAVLFGGLVFLAEETRACRNASAIQFGAGRDGACRIELHQYGVSVEAHTARQDAAKCFVVGLCQGPMRQLTLEEPVSGRFFPFGVKCLALGYFQRAQAVLIGIVPVCLFDAQGRVGVAFPAPAEIKHVVDAPDAVRTRECQSQGIIFPVAGIRYADFTQ